MHCYKNKSSRPHFLVYLLNWNSLGVDIKSTADANEFEMLLKEYYLSKYQYELDCPNDCYSCYAN